MKRQKKMRLIATMTAAMVLCCTVMTGCAEGVTEGQGAKEEPVVTAAKSLSATGDILCKDETVYVLCDTAGNVSKIIVSDWIKNGTKETSLTDVSSLNDIKVVKGNTTYSMEENGRKVWDAKSGDVYYQGTTNETLPVAMAVSYELDGKPITAEELDGKSGRVTIRFDYTNTQYEMVKIQDADTRIYVPFVMLTGMLLDKGFSNVEVTNGKVVNMGDTTAVIGFALPGMQENLNIKEEDLEIPGYFTITANVEEFSLPMTMTFAANGMFGDVDISDTEDFDDLLDSMDELTDAMVQLTDGSSLLYENLSTLLKKSNDLVSGINQIADAASALRSASGELYNGTVSLRDNMAVLESGLGELTANNDKLNGGAKQVFESLLSAADTQLAAAGLTVPKLTIENYNTVLDGVKGSLNSDSIRQMALNEAKKTVEAQVNTKRGEVELAVTEAVQKQVYAGVVAKTPFGTVEAYEAAVAGGSVDAATQQQITGAVAAQMASDEIKATISAKTDEQIQALIGQAMASPEVQAKIEAAVAGGASGGNAISSLQSQLNQYREFYDGVLAYTDGAKAAYEGSVKLKEGSDTLVTYMAQASDGMNQLDEAMTELKTQSAALPDGVSKLTDGAMQLSEGIQTLNDEGIQKLADFVNGDVEDLIDRMKAVVDVSKDYNNFSGIADGMDGSVKFIYKTGSNE